MASLEEIATLDDQRRLYGAALYEVALSGNVSEFKSLMEKDQRTLDRAWVMTSFDKTPLHIAAMRGHLDLTKELLKRSPNLATALDSSWRCPLHWASVNGHTDIVRELLQVDSGVCSFGDEDGTTPLHLAAIKGRVEVIQEIVRCRPESIRKTLDSSGETVLHLCVKHNRLEALKLLMELMQNKKKLLMEESVINEDEFVNDRDNCGNTILHLASALKQVKTVEYLIQIEAVKRQAKVKNRDGLTALDILEHDPIMDSRTKSTKIRRLLLQAESNLESQNGCCSCKTVKQRAWGIWEKYFKINEKWIEVARGNLIMTAALTATVAFQAGLNPPGSVWQSKEDFVKSTSKSSGPGLSILATLYEDDFTEFMSFNTISFLSSVCVILMMISGFPLNNKFFILVLTLAMCTTLTFMVLTYLKSLYMLTPAGTFHTVLTIYSNSLFTGIALFALVSVIHLTHVLVWAGNNWQRAVNSIKGCWNTVAAAGKPAGTGENESHHHQSIAQF